MLKHNTYWVYMLKCSNNTYYTGYTTNLSERYIAHCNNSSKCKYTRSFKPEALVQSWSMTDKTTALKVEAYIKKLTRSQKISLIAKPEHLYDFFSLKTVSTDYLQKINKMQKR